MLYYLWSGGNTVNAQKCREHLGLGYAIRSGGPSVSRRMEEHNGAPPGALFSFTTDNLAGATEAVFEPYPGREGLYIGFDPHNRPRPANFARKDQLQGHPVELADGGVWEVPPARLVNGASALPQITKWNGDHWVPAGNRPEHAALFSASCAVWDSLIEEMSGGDFEVSVNDGLNLACQGLALNYAIGPAEVSALGLLDTEAAKRVLLALVDWPSVEKLLEQGKEAAAEQSPGLGGKGSSRATNQPSLTC